MKTYLKSLLITSVIVALFLVDCAIVWAAPTSTIVTNLIINSATGGGTLCLQATNNGLVVTSTAACGTGSGGFSASGTIGGVLILNTSSTATTTLNFNYVTSSDTLNVQNITITGTCTGCPGASGGGSFSATGTAAISHELLFFNGTYIGTSSAALQFATTTGIFAVTGTSSLQTLTFTTASGTNISVSGYGTFPSLFFTNGSGTRLTASTGFDGGRITITNASATTAHITNLFDVSGNKYVTSTGSGTPSAPIGGLQYNESSAFAASGTLTFATTTKTLHLYGIASSTEIRSPSGTVFALFDASGNKYVTSTGGGIGTLASTTPYTEGLVLVASSSNFVSTTSTVLVNSATSPITLSAGVVACATCSTLTTSGTSTQFAFFNTPTNISSTAALTFNTSSLLFTVTASSSFTTVSSSNVTASGYVSAANLYGTGLTSGNCVQASTGGLLTTAAGACSTGLSNGVSDQVMFFNSASTATSSALFTISTSTGIVTISSSSITNASGTNSSVSGYGLFPSLFFTSASGTNLTVSGYLGGLAGFITSVSSTRIDATTGGTIVNVSSTRITAATSLDTASLFFTNATGSASLSVGSTTIATSTLIENTLLYIATSSPILAVANTGNVGVGSSTPGKNFVVSNRNGSSKVEIDTTNNTPNSYFQIQASSSDVNLFSVASSGLVNFGAASTTASIGGSSLAAGACATTNVVFPASGPNAVTITSSSVPYATPRIYPGDSSYWKAWVNGSQTITVAICEAVLGTPTASTYNLIIVGPGF